MTYVFGISAILLVFSGFSCQKNVIDESQGFEQGSFFENEAIVFFNTDENRLYLSLSLIRGTSPVSGSGTFGTFHIYWKNSGTSSLSIRQTSTYFYHADG